MNVIKTIGQLKPVKFVKKNSPEILVIGGVIGVVASAVGACKATLKLEETIDEIKNDIDEIHEKEALTEENDYTESDIKKDMTKTYILGAGKIARLYAPSIISGVVSIGCIVGSHKILKKRNIALLSAYNALDTSYRAYRSRVKNKLGEDEEMKLYLGSETTEIETEDKNGKKKTKKVESFDLSKFASPYAVIFDESNPNWEKDPEINKFFLVNTQNYCNDLLQAQGYLFLNDVRKKLGLEPTSAGQIVGWLKNGNGDGFIDFGIFDTSKWKNVDFVNGYERSIILDFNVDGPIINDI